MTRAGLRPVRWTLGPGLGPALGLMLVAGCFADPPQVTSDTQADSGSESSTGAPATGDPTDGSVTLDTGTESRGTTEAGSTTGMDTEDTTGAGPVCGDGVVEGDERCDGRDLAGEDCASQGLDAGRLACASDCTFDLGGCVAFACGNDQIEGREVCDGTDLGGHTCRSEGFDDGELTCQDDCLGLDISACISFSCGNDMIEGAEVCDGTDLAGEDCVSLGLVGGTLGCTAGCNGFDTSGCLTCGNDAIDGAEVCDGLDFDGESCVSLGYEAGTLTCAPDCTGFGTLGCGTISDCCHDNGTPGCDSPACEAEVCMMDAFCCEMEWDNVCAVTAQFECGVCLGTGCPHLVCDAGIALMPACDPCVDLVCTAQPSCCSGAWDATCVGLVASQCSAAACP